MLASLLAGWVAGWLVCVPCMAFRSLAQQHITSHTFGAAGWMVLVASPPRVLSPRAQGAKGGTPHSRLLRISFCLSATSFFFFNYLALIYRALCTRGFARGRSDGPHLFNIFFLLLLLLYPHTHQSIPREARRCFAQATATTLCFCVTILRMAVCVFIYPFTTTTKKPGVGGLVGWLEGSSLVAGKF